MMNKNNTEKELTGYPSIDKPHYRFYRTNPIRDIDVNQTIYELVFKSNEQNMSDPALEYGGVTWTFEKLKTETDKAACAFVNSGLKKGDTVLIGVSNCPEAVVILLALNKLGVVSKWFDIRASENNIQEYANGSNCRYLITFDLLLPRIQTILDNTCIEQVLVIYPSDSLPKAKQTTYELFKANRIPKGEKYTRFKAFVKMFDDGSPTKCVPFDKSRPSIMIQSSGTTGKPKTIVHSDLSATACVNSISYSDIPIGVEKELLVLLPPWIAYTLGNAIILPLALGSKIILSPSFEPEKIIDYLGQFTICFSAPFCYRYLIDHINSLSSNELSGIRKIECLVSGGDKITVDENQQMEKAISTVVVNGYGNNESWGVLSVNPTQHNKYGTVGIPKYGDTVIAYDNDAQKELPYGESGEICVLTETMFLYYEGNQEQTNAVKKVHPDGKIWLHTGDLGYIDEDGFITLNGRARRVIVRMGFKISAYTIEDKICELPYVKECVTVEVHDEDEEHVPMAYIAPQETDMNESEIKNGIMDKCKRELKDYEVPKHLRIVEKLPYTPNGKYDFRLLETQGNEYVDKLDKGE